MPPAPLVLRALLVPPAPLDLKALQDQLVQLALLVLRVPLARPGRFI